MPNGKPNTIEQFWAWVPLDNPDEDVCTLWQGPRWPNGYGRFRNQLGMSDFAHRAINEILHGKIPDGLDVLHRCDNRPCIRDSHHWRGTHDENMQDMVIKGRSTIGEKNPNSTITEVEVLAIRDLASKGIPNHIIADVFKVSREMAYRIIARRTWAHI